LEEWFEAITWAQLGYHKKPCGLLNINSYYTPLISLFDHMIEHGFVKREYKELILIDKDPTHLIEKMRNHNQADFTPKWG
jgi:predicted Rossmann-fold nucleotide-binding protein